MAKTLQEAIACVEDRVSELVFQPVAKTIWGSPAGKKRLAPRLAKLLPSHRVYVEPFAGSGAVFFEKEPAEVEVLNDADPQIARAFKLIKKLTADKIMALSKLTWVGDKATFMKLHDTEPKSEVEELHRFLYLTHFSYGKMRGKSFSQNVQGVTAQTMKRIERFGPRLKDVKVYSGDYEPVMRKHDGADTVFFLDPPYFGYDANVGESAFDEERFFKVLKSLKGKWLMTYGIRGKLPKMLKEAGYFIKRIRTRRTIGSMLGAGGPSVLAQLLVANYDFEKTKAAHREEAKKAELEKAQPFGTFGGSFHYAKRIIPLIPKHKTYVEPFAGAAAMLHRKEPSEVEVLADMDDDLMFMHRFIKTITPEQVQELERRFNWKVSKESFEKARDMTPKDDVARFYKLVFIRTHARDGRPDGTHPATNHLGSTTNPEKYLKAADRLKDVTLLRQDYRKTIAKYDAPDTFFFIDPPYPGEWFDPTAVIDLQEFTETLRKIRGKFIAVLNPTPENIKAFQQLGEIFRLKVRETSGLGGSKKAYRLFVANFPINRSKAKKIEIAEPPRLEKACRKSTPAPFSAQGKILKDLDPDDERYVLGVVLVPERVDAQGDVYSHEEVRRAAHRFMEEFGGLGLMHELRVNDQVKVLESYLAPTGFEVGGVEIPKGTWLLAVRVKDDDLWERVRSGQLTGFSIGGSARRVPEPTAQEGEDVRA